MPYADAQRVPLACLVSREALACACVSGPHTYLGGTEFPRYISLMHAPILTREQAIERLRSAEAEIRRLGVTRLALFGSVVRNQATPTSDVDVLVEFDPAMKTLDTFMELAFLLDAVLGRRVEVVTTEALSPYIGPHILREVEDVLRAA